VICIILNQILNEEMAIKQICFQYLEGRFMLASAEADRRGWGAR
jgi:hypothetical protein